MLIAFRGKLILMCIVVSGRVIQDIGFFIFVLVELLTLLRTFPMLLIEKYSAVGNEVGWHCIPFLETSNFLNSLLQMSSSSKEPL